MSQNFKIALFAAMVSIGGLPIYIHLPNFAAQNLGISFGALALIFAFIRIVDFVQDPFIGRFIDRNQNRLPRIVVMVSLLFAISIITVFTLASDAWNVGLIVALLIVLFTCASFMSILLYAFSGNFGKYDPVGHARLREMSILIGVIIAAILPFILQRFTVDTFAVFGLIAGVLIALVGWFTRDIWTGSVEKNAAINLQKLHQIGAQPLLMLQFLNTLPIALTSTLFIFFVQDYLKLEAFSGLYLMLYFLGAALAMPIWSGLLKRFRTKHLLLSAMCASILIFIWAAILPEGSLYAFGLISILSGMAIAGELLILPMRFSLLLESNGLRMGQAYGIWSFINKSALSIAAIGALPLLALTDFEPGKSNSDVALFGLVFAYSILPCMLKCAAIFIAIKTPRELLP